MSVKYQYVSICVPVYKVEKYIERCILSIMGQSYRGKMECLIVDDCGTDSSISIAEQLISEYKGPITFHILHHEHNRGLAAARNTAVEAAQGDFIVHVDSDDWVEPTMIEELVAKQLETNADIVSCNAIAHYPHKEELLTEPDYASKEEMMRSLLQLTLDHVIWRRLIRTSLYTENHITAVEGVNIGEDHYTVPRLLFYAKTFAKCNAALYHYNCMNVNSYIQSAETSFNAKRMMSDVASLDILIDFFGKSAPSYLDQLYVTKSRYIYDRFFTVLKLGDKKTYKEMSANWGTIDKRYKEQMGLNRLRYSLLAPSFYHINRIRVLSRIVTKKIFKVRLYNL